MAARHRASLKHDWEYRAQVRLGSEVPPPVIERAAAYEEFNRDRLNVGEHVYVTGGRYPGNFAYVVGLHECRVTVRFSGTQQQRTLEYTSVERTGADPFEEDDGESGAPPPPVAEAVEAPESPCAGGVPREVGRGGVATVSTATYGGSSYGVGGDAASEVAAELVARVRSVPRARRTELGPTDVEAMFQVVMAEVYGPEPRAPAGVLNQAAEQLSRMEPITLGQMAPEAEGAPAPPE